MLDGLARRLKVPPIGLKRRKNDVWRQQGSRGVFRPTHLLLRSHLPHGNGAAGFALSLGTLASRAV
ncbi:hypothetical protein RvY_18418 [Ramazzottius varieornatus]|uniref:Uncharacterized protein n=1 Tax=Ramazzottius varieornatus TaxID=947166 RepID=A0A1D1W5P7_RAMVA|nr:hypothetical protein RvY_18418 [Ramazzottius varieornatus]